KILFLLLLIVQFAACAKKGTDDESISNAIKGRYYEDSELRSEKLDVSVAQGEVTIKGEVSTDQARVQALNLAKQVPGVKNVNDLIRGTAAPPVPKLTEQNPPPTKNQPKPPAREPPEPPAPETSPSSSAEAPPEFNPQPPKPKPPKTKPQTSKPAPLP